MEEQEKLVTNDALKLLFLIGLIITTPLTIVTKVWVMTWYWHWFAPIVYPEVITISFWQMFAAFMIWVFVAFMLQSLLKENKKRKAEIEVEEESKIEKLSKQLGRNVGLLVGYAVITWPFGWVMHHIILWGLS